MEELLDIFNEKEEKKGVKARGDVHRDGDWHETFHCWFVKKIDSKWHVLLQKRAFDKEDYPGLYDITAAGHLEAGEGLIEGGLREIQEELGLSLERSALTPAGYVKEELIGKDKVDREICRLFFYHWPGGDLPVGVEVADVLAIPLDQLSSLMTGDREVAAGVSICTGEKERMKAESFVPHTPAYQSHLLKALSEYVEKL
ncbi:NUDIX domain-containing protein [Halobacillus kuroshimensis]|uniref:NUDIX domain-containing protein n=1 Tax=Halobacillus kuroshimensis TaxID=302481 RepID=A0ABS3E0B7_9BACI|nr:NUDIX domain-containing protein [Halobacillus kuroshimensis]MBN8237016.1 NUDIX domain-containing protein [Halobacillus kuroshimensis]